MHLPAATVAPAIVLVFLGFVMKAAMLPVRIDFQMHPALARRQSPATSPRCC